MRNLSEVEESIFFHLMDKWGDGLRVFSTEDLHSDNEIFVASVKNTPHKGYTSYSTIGLSNYPHFSGEVGVRLELAGCALDGVEKFGDLLASSAYYSLSKGCCITYGSVIQNIVYDHSLSRSLEHLTFVSPFLWDPIKYEYSSELTVHWLLAIPISSGEANFLIEHGILALEKMFEEYNIDILDIERDSVI